MNRVLFHKLTPQRRVEYLLEELIVEKTLSRLMFVTNVITLIFGVLILFMFSLGYTTASIIALTLLVFFLVVSNIYHFNIAKEVYGDLTLKFKRDK